MNEHTLLVLLTIFVTVAAIALLGQAAALVGLFWVARGLREKVFASWPQIESIIGTSKRSLEQAEQHIGKIGNSSAAILDVTRQQLVKVDELLTDASSRARVQMDRAEMVLDDTMTRVQQTVGVVQTGIVTPVRQVHGILSGIRGAIGYLSRAGRPTVERVTSDEEMFI